MSTSITRREILQRLGILAAALSMAPLADAALPGCPTWFTVADVEALHALGHEYRTAYGDDAGIAGVDSILNGDEAHAVGTFQRLVSDDYQEGRLIRLGGWHLSRTEGRLVAAAASRC